MSKPSRAVLGAIVVALCAVAALVAGVAHRGSATAAPATNCQLGNKDGQIKHVVYLQFDNTHYRRDNAERRLRPRADAEPARTS